MEMHFKKLGLVERACPYCLSKDLERVWKYQFNARTKKTLWEFQVNNVICKDCGFVFVSPAPSAQDLSDYYFESYVRYDKQKLDYNPEKRIQFINKNATQKELFIEIGSNKQSIFHEKIKNIFGRVITVELNGGVDSDLQDISEIPDGEGDMLAHYFVLEHIPDLSSFLRQCNRVLKNGGIMICEVPDIALYSEHLSPLMLHEHVNHFSVKTLIGIAEKYHFRHLNFSHELCSREFGFAVAFSKQSNTPDDQKVFCNEYTSNKTYFQKALEKISRFEIEMTKAREVLNKFSSNNRPVIFWGANDNLIRFMGSDISMPQNAFIVDSDPAKKSFLFNMTRIYVPDQIEQETINRAFFIIFTRLHSRAILDSIRTRFGKTLTDEDFLVLDT